MSRILLIFITMCNGHLALANNAGPYAEENFGGITSITSSYMFRGISYSSDNPALKLLINWHYQDFFAGVLTSSLSDLDGNGYELESDFLVGYSGKNNGYEWFVMPIYYHLWDNSKKCTKAFFGGCKACGLDANMAEIWFDVNKPIDNSFMDANAHLLYAYSPDFAFDSGEAHYLYSDLTFNIIEGLSLNIGLGRQIVEGGEYANAFGGGWGYTHVELGLVKKLGKFNLDIRYHKNTDDGDEDDLRRFVLKEAVDETIVFTLERHF